MDKIRDEVMRRETGVSELRGKLKETRLRWLGHIVRRDEGYVGKRMRALAVGKRKPGRPKRRREGCVKEDRKTFGIEQGRRTLMISLLDNSNQKTMGEIVAIIYVTKICTEDLRTVEIKRLTHKKPLFVTY